MADYSGDAADSGAAVRHGRMGGGAGADRHAHARGGGFRGRGAVRAGDDPSARRRPGGAGAALLRADGLRLCVLRQRRVLRPQRRCAARRSGRRAAEDAGAVLHPAGAGKRDARPAGLSFRGGGQRTARARLRRGRRAGAVRRAAGGAQQRQQELHAGRGAGGAVGGDRRLRRGVRLHAGAGDRRLRELLQGRAGFRPADAGAERRPRGGRDHPRLRTGGRDHRGQPVRLLQSRRIHRRADRAHGDGRRLQRRPHRDDGRSGADAGAERGHAGRRRNARLAGERDGAAAGRKRRRRRAGVLLEKCRGQPLGALEQRGAAELSRPARCVFRVQRLHLRGAEGRLSAQQDEAGRGAEGPRAADRRSDRAERRAVRGPRVAHGRRRRRAALRPSRGLRRAEGVGELHQSRRARRGGGGRRSDAASRLRRRGRGAVHRGGRGSTHRSGGLRGGFPDGVEL